MAHVQVDRYIKDKMRDKTVFEQNMPFISSTSVSSEKMKPRSWSHGGL